MLLFALSACSLGSGDDEGTLEGIVGCYAFASSALDESGNGNDGVVFGASETEDRFGRENRAYAFDGIDDYILIPHTDSLDFGALGEDYSLSLWILPQTQKDARIIEKWNRRVGTPYPFQISTISDGFLLAAYDGMHTANLEVNFPEDEEWHHLAFVANTADSLLYVYLDRNLVSSERLPAGSRMNESPIVIGAVPEATVDRYFEGKIDDLYFFDHALSEAELTILNRKSGCEG